MACTVSVPRAPVNWRFSMITATSGTTIRVFGAALAGSVMLRCPAWADPALLDPRVAGRRAGPGVEPARGQCQLGPSTACPGSVTARLGIRDEALAGPAASVISPVPSSPAASALGRITGDPPE